MENYSSNNQNTRKPGRGRRVAAAAGILAATTAAGAVGYNIGEKAGSPDVTDIARQEITTDIALGHMVDVLPGTVVVFNKEGQINIQNPILRRDPDSGTVVVAQRTPGSDAGEGSLVVTYRVGFGGVTEITAFDNADAISSDGTDDLGKAFGATVRTEVERSPGLSVEGNDGLRIVNPGSTGAWDDPASTLVAQGVFYPKYTPDGQ